MQSSTQSVGLKNGFFFRTTHFPSHFWLTRSPAGHQPLGGLLDPCRDQTSCHGGGKWRETETLGIPGAWGLKTSWILVDETSCGKNGESHHLKIASDIKISQDISRYHRWWNIPCFLAFHRLARSGELPRSHNSPCEMSLRMAQGFNAQAGQAGWMLGPSCNRERNVVEITTNSVFGGYFTVIMNQLWPTGINNKTPLQ